MRIRRVTAAVLTAIVLPLTAACETNDNQRSDADSSASEDSGSSDGGEDGGGSDAKDTDGSEGELPDVVGQGMKSAHDATKKAGFSKITIHDALGRDRAQAVVRNWKICFQEPEAGKHATDTKVDLGAVKTDEECPDQDERPEAAESAFPDFSGKSLRAARNALDDSTGFRAEDASDENRVILVQSNWKICSQEPKAGTEVNGQPVTFKAVKFDEKCP